MRLVSIGAPLSTKTRALRGDRGAGLRL